MQAPTGYSSGKVKVLYLQEGKILKYPARRGKALRVLTILDPDDFNTDGSGVYNSNEDVASFFVVAGERVDIGECPACGTPVDRNEIRSPTGLTAPSHLCNT